MRASLLFLLPHAIGAFAASAADWRGRTIYQIITDRFATSDDSTPECNTSDKRYCGGTWQGIINKLDYIQGLGISAIWISPVVQNIPAGDKQIGDPYHGYWQNNIYSLNPYFGTPDDLRALSDAVHDRGMFLMVDVITNHLAYPGAANYIDYSTLIPFNRSYYYHPYCPITDNDYKYNQRAVEECWLGDANNELVDLNTTRTDVTDVWYSWISDLVTDYSIDGLRVDTVKHISKTWWPGFNAAADVFCLGEVADGAIDYVCPYQDVMDGVVNYPLYYVMLRALQDTNGNMTALQNAINGIKFQCKDSTLLAPFAENHDRPRVPSITSDPLRAKNMIAFTGMADGIPIIYAGQEQYYTGGQDPANREAIWLSGYDTDSDFYTFTTKVLNFRNHANDISYGFNLYKQLPIYHDNHTIALLKGDTGVQVVTVFSNIGSAGVKSQATLRGTNYNTGDSLIEILECTQTIVSSSGLTITNTGLPQIWYAEANLVGSGICGK